MMGKYLNGYPGDGPLPPVPVGWDEWYVPVDGHPYDEFRYVLDENGHTVDYGDRAADYMVDVLAAKPAEFIRDSAERSQPSSCMSRPMRRTRRTSRLRALRRRSSACRRRGRRRSTSST